MLKMGKETVGQKLRLLRDSKGLSQRQMAMRCGLDRGYISQLESGKTESITLRTAETLAKGLDMPATVFFDKETPEDILERLRLAQPISIPVYTKFPFPGGELTDPLEYVYRERKNNPYKNVEGYLVKGYSLQPDIQDGDVIIVERDGQIDPGNIVACLYHSGLHLGRLRKIDGKMYLETNERRMNFQCFQFAAPVIEVIRRLK